MSTRDKVRHDLEKLEELVRSAQSRLQYTNFDYGDSSYKELQEKILKLKIQIADLFE